MSKIDRAILKLFQGDTLAVVTAFMWAKENNNGLAEAMLGEFVEAMERGDEDRAFAIGEALFEYGVRENAALDS